ncbi:hypothetical protein FHS44_006060 [Streptosporangium saharense]|uniref:Uncharacterized protein n=1 Tax=Streptosporangium saharense TaxID=1706840 RepID=A0A7W7QSK0_9ACTN|nr:hypothetical protein [Streptosporangium saharense]
MVCEMLGSGRIFWPSLNRRLSEAVAKSVYGLLKSLIDLARSGFLFPAIGSPS